MGVVKDHLFTGKQNQLASLAKVLGHPARIAILHYLIRKRTCSIANWARRLSHMASIFTWAPACTTPARPAANDFWRTS